MLGRREEPQLPGRGRSAFVAALYDALPTGAIYYVCV